MRHIAASMPSLEEMGLTSGMVRSLLATIRPVDALRPFPAQVSSEIEPLAPLISPVDEEQQRLAHAAQAHRRLVTARQDTLSSQMERLQAQVNRLELKLRKCRETARKADKRAQAAEARAVRAELRLALELAPWWTGQAPPEDSLN